MVLLTLDRLRARRSRTGATLTIGLVNNMPDAALKTTEWQVRDLLSRAANRRAISLRVFALPEIPRSEAGRAYVHQHHEDIARLWQDGVDGLIITGTEPKAARFEDEPYWPALTRLIDWADENTCSAVWSCLACHAAAYRLDGIKRQKFARKMFGVFDCEKAANHALVNGPPRWPTPHSRYNGVTERDLRDAGYQVLSRSEEAGVDIFVRKRRSLFVFLQGHPEYDATALFGEYRRDVRHFLCGEREEYPPLPRGYLSDEATSMLQQFRKEAEQQRAPALLKQFPAAAIGRELTAPWRGAAARIYGNWLTYLTEHRARRSGRAGTPVSLVATSA